MAFRTKRVDEVLLDATTIDIAHAVRRYGDDLTLDQRLGSDRDE